MHIQDEFKVNSITPQRDHSGPEQGALATKVRLSTVTNVDKLKGILRSPDAFQLAIENLYAEDGTLKVPEQTKVHLDVKGTGLVISLNSEFGDSIEFKENNKIDGIKYTLLDGHRCELDLKILVHPDDEQISILMGMLLNSVTFAAVMKDTVEEETKEKQQSLPVDTQQPIGSEDGSDGEATPKKPERKKGVRQLPKGQAHGDGEKPVAH